MIQGPTNSIIPVAVPVVLGAAAVYLLLPKPRMVPFLVGAMVGITALVVSGLFWLRDAAGVYWVEAALFYSFTGLALLGGVALVTNRNPARGAVSFALVILSVCGLFLLLGAPFLMAGTIIIYAGAIIVTFLFVIMLAHQHGASNADARTREPLLACIAGGMLLAILLGVIRDNYDAAGIEGVQTALEQAVNNRELNSVRAAIRAVPNLAFRAKLEALEGEFAARIDQAETVEAKDQEMERFRQSLRYVASHVGDLVPPDHLVVSGWSGQPSNRMMATQLPAGNVAALGRSLYSDYVLGVELGGTLLLVATVGAIAITRRTPSRAVS